MGVFVCVCWVKHGCCDLWVVRMGVFLVWSGFVFCRWTDG